MRRRTSHPKSVGAPSRRGLIVSGTILGIVIVSALLAPWIAPNPSVPDLSNTLLPPLSPGHPLGTDALGRDVLSRIIWGGRVSLVVAFFGVIGSLTLGTLAGFVTGFGGRRSQYVVMRLIDAQLAFPYVLLAIAIASAVPPSLATLVLLMVLAGWAPAARVIRSVVLTEVEKDYIMGAQGIGASRRRIVFKYLSPAVRPVLLALGPLQMSAMIVMESTLSFLGLGVQPPTPSWGGMMLDGKPYLTDAWWITTFAGIAIAFTAGALLGLGRGVEDQLAWRRRQRATATESAGEQALAADPLLETLA